MRKTYTFYSDPGHGWLRVPKSELPGFLRKKISHYSYESDRYVYLEEDCDAMKFLEHLKAGGIEYGVKNVFQDRDSHIRRLPRIFQPITGSFVYADGLSHD